MTTESVSTRQNSRPEREHTAGVSHDVTGLGMKIESKKGREGK